ncbi:MAG: hypothetical protein QW482_01665 [Thermoproteota archaeon]
MNSLESRKMIVLGMVLMLTFSLVVALALALEAKPDVYVEPNSIPTNGIVYIHIRAYDPPGNDPNVPDDFQYILVHKVCVWYPGDMYGHTEEFMLCPEPGDGIPDDKRIRIEYGEDIAIPFGTPMTGVPITIKGETYYWWRSQKGGGPVSPNEKGASTEWSGKYMADVEGIACYGDSEEEIRLIAWFDIPYEFFVPEFGLTVTAISLFAYWAILRKRKSRK